MHMHTNDGNPSVAPLTGRLEDEAATRALGAALGSVIEPGMVLHLHGDLGAGKTALVRACLLSLGCREKVKSPSYTLVELYLLSRLDFYHFDFYRFKSAEEWDTTGFSEYFHAGAVCAIEWPEKIGARLPPADLRIRLEFAQPGRTYEIAAGSTRGERCLKRLRTAVAGHRAPPVD
ncbi:MAG: tRNA (adenosine(37)-N6)-threonylcarbamoyltransferase complex ATPase subunit type 1 TsaE [Betaproteobacteria bacterium]|nr:tRNA (adenosine(37)-N6)-threonylcarbamoyltransferase complex ATPase subunit type 1 TsaE [Betaproteobacteria bacterium]